MFHNQTAAAQNLLLAVLQTAILDAVRPMPSDHHDEPRIERFDWVLGPVAEKYLKLIGLSDEAIFGLRLRVLTLRLDPGGLDMRRLHAQRWGGERLQAAAHRADWQSWPVLEATTLGR